MGEASWSEEGMVSDPPFTSRHQKDAARKREARYRGGLDECSNAEKQVKAPGLEYVEEPEAAGSESFFLKEYPSEYQELQVCPMLRGCCFWGDFWAEALTDPFLV
eukprot:s4885_g3.t1